MQQPDQGPQPSPPPPPGFGPPPPPHAPPPAQPYAPPPPQGYAPPPPPQPYAPYPAPPPPSPQPAVPAGLEFLAVDRHNSIVVDASGVSFEDHGRNIDFSWPEIRSVHCKPHTDNKGLVMGVVHVDGRFYECVVDAKRHDRLQEWFGRLLAVLRYYRPMG